MDGRTTDTILTATAGREPPKDSMRDRPAEALEHLRRLRTSCINATQLISPLIRGGPIDEQAAALGAAHGLDVLAFSIAVDTGLFLDAVKEGALITDDEMEKWLGLTLAATARLLCSLEASHEKGTAAEGNKGHFGDASNNIEKVVKGLRMRLSILCGSWVVAEFRSFALTAVGHGGQKNRRPW